MYTIKKGTTLWLAAVLITSSLLLTKCTTLPVSSTKIEHANISHIEGTEFNRVILSEKAAQRLDIQTVSVREALLNGMPRLVIPYAAVLYGLHGETWAYTSPQALTFIRESITIDHIEGDIAYLTKGPVAGTQVAAVGVAELYGADTGVGK